METNPSLSSIDAKKKSPGLNTLLFRFMRLELQAPLEGNGTWVLAQIKYAALQLPLKQCLNQSIKANSCHRLSFVLRPLSSPLPLTANCGQKRATRERKRARARESVRKLWLIKYAHKFKSRCPDNSPQLFPILQFPAYPRLLSLSLFLSLSVAWFLTRVTFFTVWLKRLKVGFLLQFPRKRRRRRRKKAV